MDLTTNCYKNLEKAEVLVNVLQEKYLHKQDTTIILNIISTNIKFVTETLLEIQDKIR